jgi:hypothetical protein
MPEVVLLGCGQGPRRLFPIIAGIVRTESKTAHPASIARQPAHRLAGKRNSASLSNFLPDCLSFRQSSEYPSSYQNFSLMSREKNRKFVEHNVNNKKGY